MNGCSSPLAVCCLASSSHLPGYAGMKLPDGRVPEHLSDLIGSICKTVLRNPGRFSGFGGIFRELHLIGRIVELFVQFMHPEITGENDDCTVFHRRNQCLPVKSKRKFVLIVLNDNQFAVGEIDVLCPFGPLDVLNLPAVFQECRFTAFEPPPAGKRRRGDPCRWRSGLVFFEK